MSTADDYGSPGSIPLGRLTHGDRHTSFYLEAGPKTGPTIIFVHGWPEIALAWRHQLATFAALGFRVIAPDLRGTGQSTIYDLHSAYSQREIVRDMLDLADVLDVDRALWVGHDWGASVVWNIATHYPERCHATAALCVPYQTLELGVDQLSSLVNRDIYPAAKFPAGQFEYIKFYHEQFDNARRAFEINFENTFKVHMRRGDPSQAGKPFPTALVRRQGGWFGGGGAPDVALDRAILDDGDLDAYSHAYRQTGFFGVNSLYMNDLENNRFAREADDSAIDMPVLFLSGLNDFVCDTERSDLMVPMRSNCRKLTIQKIASGHWMQHECPSEVNATLSEWVASEVPTMQARPS